MDFLVISNRNTYFDSAFVCMCVIFFSSNLSWCTIQHINRQKFVLAHLASFRCNQESSSKNTVCRTVIAFFIISADVFTISKTFSLFLQGIGCGARVLLEIIRAFVLKSFNSIQTNRSESQAITLKHAICDLTEHHFD